MSKTEVETEEPETEDTGETGGISMGELKDLIKETISEVMGSSGGQPKKPVVRQTHNERVDSVAAEVEAALDRVGKRKEAEEADKNWRISVDERLAEKPPVQRRKIHHVMGWGE